MKLFALCRPALVGAALLASLSTHAAIVTHGYLSTDGDVSNIITDSLNNVEYLRWDVLADLTYAQTLAVLDTQDGGGWAIADGTVAVDFATALLGGTVACSHDGFGVTVSACGTTTGWMEGDFGENWFASSDLAWFLNNNGQADHVTVFSDDRVLIGTSTLVASDNHSADGAFPDYPGAWLLVRPSASVVPVPAAGWLFMTALLGLAGRKRLSRR